MTYEGHFLTTNPSPHQRAFSCAHGHAIKGDLTKRKTMTKTKAKDQYDVSLMSITPEPYEKFANKIVTSKYDDIFSKLGENQRLKCSPEAAARVATQLKKWLRARGHKNITTKSRTNCGDGFGGVWWMEVKESKAAQVFKTKIAPKAAWPTIRKAA